MNGGKIFFGFIGLVIGLTAISYVFSSGFLKEEPFTGMLLGGLSILCTSMSVHFFINGMVEDK